MTEEEPFPDPPEDAHGFNSIMSFKRQLMKYTEEQIENWKAYEEVREQGEFNMFAREARAMSGLDQEDYVFCMKNYEGLEKQANGGEE